jgi:hypothetical protein
MLCCSFVVHGCSAVLLVCVLLFVCFRVCPCVAHRLLFCARVLHEGTTTKGASLCLLLSPLTPCPPLPFPHAYTFHLHLRLRLLLLLPCAEVEGLARIGVACLQLVIVETGPSFDAHTWNLVCGTIVRLFHTSTPFELLPARRPSSFFASEVRRECTLSRPHITHAGCRKFVHACKHTHCFPACAQLLRVLTGTPPLTRVPPG